MSQIHEWLAYLETLPSGFAITSLDHVKHVAAQLKLRKFTCPVIVVAGTNGKGSCVTFLETIFSAAGYKTAAYTSPHVIKYNERIRLNGQNIDDNNLCAAFNAVKTAKNNTNLSYFEFTTLAALYLFQQHNPDIIILEVGLGGRLDAVNIVDADIAIITTISLDHTQLLGKTREDIGKEKSGIMRANKPVICGDFDPPSSIYQQAANINAPLYCANRDFTFTTTPHDWTWQHNSITLKNLPLPHLPIQNAATAIMAIQLMQQKLPVPTTAITTGLSQATLLGRLQTIEVTYSQIGFQDMAQIDPRNFILCKAARRERPKCMRLYMRSANDKANAAENQISTGLNNRTIILDVAHNPESTTLLAKNLTTMPCRGKTLAVTSMLKDKDIPASLQPIASSIDKWFIGSLDSPRAASQQQLHDSLESIGIAPQKIQYFHNIKAALQQAVASAEKNDRIVAFGSFYVVATVLKILGSDRPYDSVAI